LEDGGFADAGGEGGKVGGEGGGESGGRRGDFVAEVVEMFLRGGDGAGGEELLEPGIELRVVSAGGFVAEEGEECGGVIWTQVEVEKDDAVGFAFTEIEAGAGATLEAEGVGEVVLHLVGGAEAGEGLSGGAGEVIGELGKDGGGAGGEGEEGAGFGFGHFFVGGERRSRGVEVDFGGLPGGGFAEGGGEDGAGGGKARGKGERLSDEEGAEVDGLAASESAPSAGLAAAHFVAVLQVIEDERGVVEEFDGGGEGDAVFGGKLQTFGEVEGEAGTDAFAGALEDVDGGLSEVAGSAGGIAKELFDESEAVVGLWRGGAVGGRHREREEGENLRAEGGRKKAAGARSSPGRGEFA
jgi:hypothetical protein